MILPLTVLYPAPLDVILGGRTFQVDAMRVGDLADLQAWLDRRSGSPVDELRASLPTMEPTARKRALWAVWEALMEGPILWGGEEARRLFLSDQGLTELLRVILRHRHPELAADPEALWSLATEIVATDPAQIGRLKTAWARPDPLDEVEELLEIDAPPGKNVGWVQAVAEVVESTGWTLDTIRTLPVSALRAIRSGGKARDRGVSVGPTAPRGSLKAVMMQARAKYRKERGIDDGNAS